MVLVLLAVLHHHSQHCHHALQATPLHHVRHVGEVAKIEAVATALPALAKVAKVVMLGMLAALPAEVACRRPFGSSARQRQGSTLMPPLHHREEDRPCKPGPSGSAHPGLKGKSGC